jgi:hypothetical protein
MNPIGKKSRKDAQKYREQYINNLALEASNNQLVTNAVKIYKETGETPTKDTDPRNTTEKYIGLEGKKQLLRDSLASNNIMTTHIADDVISSLKAPELEFFSQYREFLLKDFKGKNVPAKVFIDYLRRFIRKTNETKGIEYGLQQDGGNILIDSRLADIDDIGDDFVDEIMARLDGVEERIKAMIKKKLNDMQQFQLGDAEKRAFAEVKASTDAITTAELFALQSQIEEHTPTKDDIRDAIESVRRGDVKPFLDLTDGLSLLEPAYRELIRTLRTWTPPAPTLKAEEKEELEALPGSSGTYEGIPPPRPYGEAYAPGAEEYASASDEEEQVDGLDDFKALSTDAKRKQLSGMGEDIEDMRRLSDKQLVKLYIRKFTPVPVPPRGESAEEGKGLRGRGIGPKRKPPSGASSYKKQPAYKQFGRYILNHNKLHDNVLMVKTPSAAVIKELPTQAISHNMTRAVKTIAAGRSVSLADYHNLTEPEKQHLHHLARHSRVETDLPNPKQSDEDADLRRFEILRGERVAGNDSSEILKELKDLLKKFVKEGRLPRAEVNAILMELL